MFTILLFLLVKSMVSDSTKIGLPKGCSEVNKGSRAGSMKNVCYLSFKRKQTQPTENCADSTVAASATLRYFSNPSLKLTLRFLT